jgi:hypothetical protein
LRKQLKQNAAHFVYEQFLGAWLAGLRMKSIDTRYTLVLESETALKSRRPPSS